VARLSVTVTAPMAVAPVDVPTAPEPRSAEAGTVMPSTPVVVTANVTVVSSEQDPVKAMVQVGAAGSDRMDVAAAAGKADPMMSAPHAATPPAVILNSGLCMEFPP
jgi:hypothetical protein